MNGEFKGGNKAGFEISQMKAAHLDSSSRCRYELQLDFLEAVFGCSREIDLDRLAACTVGAAFKYSFTVTDVSSYPQYPMEWH